MSQLSHYPSQYNSTLWYCSIQGSRDRQLWEPNGPRFTKFFDPGPELDFKVFVSPGPVLDFSNFPAPGPGPIGFSLWIHGKTSDSLKHERLQTQSLLRFKLGVDSVNLTDLRLDELII